MSWRHLSAVCPRLWALWRPPHPRVKMAAQSRSLHRVASGLWSKTEGGATGSRVPSSTTPLPAVAGRRGGHSEYTPRVEGGGVAACRGCGAALQTRNAHEEGETGRRCDPASTRWSHRGPFCCRIHCREHIAALSRRHRALFGWVDQALPRLGQRPKGSLSAVRSALVQLWPACARLPPLIPSPPPEIRC